MSSYVERVPGPANNAGGIVENFFGQVLDGREQLATKMIWAAVLDWWRECPIKPPPNESAEKCREVYQRYERKAKPRLYDPATPRSILLEREGRGHTMFEEKWHRAIAQWHDRVAEAAAQPNPQKTIPHEDYDPVTGEIHGDIVEGEVASDDEDTLEIEPTRFFGLDLTDIPPRRWVYGRENLVGFVSVLGGQGGVGKSAYMMVQAFSVALGRSLLSRPGREIFHTPHMPGAVWYINGEDPMEEIKRRGAAIIKQYGIKSSDMAHEIYMDSGRDHDFIVTTRTERGSLITAPVVDAMIAAITAKSIKMLVIDPFANSHSAEENRTDEMAHVMRLWAQVASDADCAVYLLHHMRKGNISPGDADQFRGSSAVQGAARVMSTMVAMSEPEAEKLGLDPDTRRQYIRLDNAKASMSPVAEGATWFRLLDVRLSEDPKVDNGAQVVTTWDPPKAFDDFPMSVIVEALDQIDAGMDDGEPYALSPKSSRWAGNVITKLTDKSDKHVIEILEAWMENDLIREGSYVSKSNKSRERNCINVNVIKLSEMRENFNRQFRQ